MSLIDRLSDTYATLTYGGVTYACRVRQMGDAQCVYDSFGQVQYYRAYLVSGLDNCPILPCKMAIDGKTYDVSSAKEYKTFNGELLGHRVTVVQG